ncbi:MAG: hypothetical protein WA477_22755 [Candidatus Sulfotelmatobacter sp.]
MPRQFFDRHFPVHPNLEQLRHQAKDLQRDLRKRDPDAVALLRKHHPQAPDPAAAKLADAQLVLARSYGLPSWGRLVTACRMTAAICAGDVEAVRGLLMKDPRLLHEAARGLPDSNWGPPMSYAANVGQDAIIQMLRDMGATDVQHAFDRACLQGKIETARRLYQMGARPVPGCVMGPCETLNNAGLLITPDFRCCLNSAPNWPTDKGIGSRQSHCYYKPIRDIRRASIVVLSWSRNAGSHCRTRP